MKTTLLVLLLLGCGAPDLDVDAAPEALLEVPGPVGRALSVNGEFGAGGEWVPTGVAFSERAGGWRLSCLNGEAPSIEFEGRAARLRCRARPGL